MRTSYIKISNEQYIEIMEKLYYIEKDIKSYVEFIHGEPYEEGKCSHEQHMRQIKAVIDILENDDGKN